MKTPLLFMTLWLGASGPLPDPWTAEVVRALDGARVELGGRTATAVGGIRTSLLAEGATWSVPVTLSGSREYIVIATCDRDCGRLALRITDPRHYDLDADQSATRRPASRLVTQVAGVHQVEVTMVACRVDPCRVGVLILRR